MERGLLQLIHLVLVDVQIGLLREQRLLIFVAVTLDPRPIGSLVGSLASTFVSPAPIPLQQPRPELCQFAHYGY